MVCQISHLGQLLLVGKDQDQDTDNEDWDGETLPHREPVSTQQIPQLRIGETDKLNQEAEDSIEQHKHADKGTPWTWRTLSAQGKEDNKDNETFEDRFIELGGMPVDVATILKHHTPGQISRLTPELAIDKVGDTTKEDADRSTAHRYVRHAHH